MFIIINSYTLFAFRILYMFFSVLEQFEITKFSFNYFLSVFLISKEKEKQIISFISKILLFINNKILLMRFKFSTFKRFFIKIFKVLQSFFLPNSASTKNYMYSRIMSFCLKTYFKLLTRQNYLYL
jgi:hypothetical protein